MSNRTVVQFISEKRAEGASDSEITHDLLNNGWHMDIIQKAMHGEPITHRNLDPILDIKKQPYRTKLFVLVGIFLFFVGVILAIYA